VDLYRFEALADGVWAAIVNEGSGAIGNAGIVDLGDRTLVFDTGVSPAAGAELRGQAATLTGRPPALVVNSHWHGDHVYGNQAFDGIPIVATARTRQLVETAGAERLATNRAGNPALNEVRLTPPTDAFEGSLDLGRAELLTYGGGHTESDSFLYLRDERILFTADLVVVQAHPWVGDGDVGTWIEILGRIDELSAQTVSPGHGPVGTGGDVTAMRAHLERLRELEPGAPMPDEWAGLAHPEMHERNLAALHR
jgi:glyoxylase-like metal-dependent hydrolase (beta-lactamase superfamily II)